MDGSGMRRMLPGEVRWKNQRAMLPPALRVPRKRSAAAAAELPLSLDERLARAARASIRPERSVRWQRAGSVQAAEQSSVIRPTFHSLSGARADGTADEDPQSVA